MTNSRSLFAFAAVLVVSGCAPDYQQLIITGLYPPGIGTGVTCLTSTKPTVAQTRGSLNTGLSRSYLMIYAMDSLFAENDLNPDGNTAVINEIDYTYTTSAGPTGTPIGMPSSETRSISFTVKAKSSDNLVLENMIGPQAAVALDGVPVTSPSDYFVLHVTTSFKGQLVSGGTVQSSRITFPISIYNSGSDCSAGTVVNPQAACGNVGQDVSCCVPDPMTMKCP